MRRNTRRRFLAGAARSAAGVLLWPPLGTAFAAEGAPHVRFPSSPRDRIAIASYPFRDFIVGRDDRSDSGKMELKEFAAHVSAKFNIHKIEPWSAHFRSLEKPYLEQLRAAITRARGAIVNIAVDGHDCPYATDRAERERAVESSKQWIDAALIVGSPSVRTNIPRATNTEPDVGRAVESFERVARYGAGRNIVVNLENDNPVSEDPFFLVKVIEQVNSPWLRALPDFANTLAANEEEYAYRGIEAMFDKAYNISHVKETELGEGKDTIARVDLPRTFGIARHHEYKGYFSMEWDSPGDPHAGTAGLIEKTLENLC